MVAMGGAMAVKMSVGHYSDGCMCDSCIIVRAKSLCHSCAGTHQDVRGDCCKACNGWGSRMGELMVLDIRAKNAQLAVRAAQERGETELETEIV
jgi:hypothetical protein